MENKDLNDNDVSQKLTNIKSDILSLLTKYSEYSGSDFIGHDMGKFYYRMQYAYDDIEKAKAMFDEMFDDK